MFCVEAQRPGKTYIPRTSESPAWYDAQRRSLPNVTKTRKSKLRSADASLTKHGGVRHQRPLSSSRDVSNAGGTLLSDNAREKMELFILKVGKMGNADKDGSIREMDDVVPDLKVHRPMLF